MFVEIFKFGNKFCYKNKKLSLLNNSYGVAVIDLMFKTMDKEYWIDDKLHNKLGPAIIKKDSTGTIRKFYFNKGAHICVKTERKMNTVFMPRENFKNINE